MTVGPVSLLARSGIRHWQRHPWQAAFAVAGIALGVAMVVSVDLAGQSARASYLHTTETLAGRATHHVLGVEGGLSDSTFVRLKLAGLRDGRDRPLPMTPVLEERVGVLLRGDSGAARTDAAAPGGPSLRLVGVDPFSSRELNAFGLVDAVVGNKAGGPGSATAATSLSALLAEPGTVLISRRAAARLGVAPGDTLRILAGMRPSFLRVLGFLEPRNDLASALVDNLLLADIATAQEVLGRQGRLSRIEIDLSGAGTASNPETRLVTEVEARLSPGSFLAAANARALALDAVSEAFRLNLTALSLLALLVGAFLIYNTLSFAVAQRWNLLGILRGLGAEPRDIAYLVGREALVFALVGTALGLAGGVALGRGLVVLVAQTLNDLYFTAAVTSFRIEALPMLKGALLGIGAGLLAALGPAWQAASIRPRALLTRSAQETRLRGRLPLLNGLGLAAALLSAGLALWPATLLAGFASLLFAVIAWSLWIPTLLRLFSAAAAALLGRLAGVTGSAGTLVRMACREIGASLSRTAVAAAALTSALAVTVAMGVMVDGFRGTVRNWLESVLVADVYVSAPRQGTGRLQGTLDPAWVEAARRLPGIAGVTGYRVASLHFPGDSSRVGQVQILALDMDLRTRKAFRFLEGDSATAWAAWASFPAPGAQPACGLLLSEPLAFRRGVHPGDSLSLPTAAGPRRFPVAGIFQDFGSDQGMALLDRSCLDRHWSFPGHTSLALFADPGLSPDTLARRLAALPGSRAVEIHPSRSLREASLEIFDRTFAITSVLRLAAVVVAALGLIGALAALQMERAQETALLRALGLTPFQTWALAAAQSAGLGLGAGLLAIPLGIVQSALLVHVINRRSFGWSMPLDLDPVLLLQAPALGLVAALLAAALPAWRSARAVTARALREE